MADSGEAPNTETESTEEHAPNVTRREVIGGVAAAAVVFAAGGIAVGSNTATLLRPVGAEDEGRFLSLCLRCDRCRSACPHHAIVTTPLDDGLINMRTPKLDFHSGYCDFCGSKQDETAEPLCVANCPTKALREEPWSDVLLGVATIDVNECLAYSNSKGCKVCVDVCPYGAVELNDENRPIVDTLLCNGCGYCEYECPSHTYHSFSGSKNRGIYVQPLEAS